MEVKAYDGFKGELWKDEINVRNFIQENYTPYEGGDDFLAGKSEKTTKLFAVVEDLINKEIRESYRNADTSRFSSIDGFDAGYIDKENEVIVGLQTDEVLKRIVNPYGGYRMVEQSLEAYGQEMDPVQAKYFKEFRKTHNEGVFDAYTKDMRTARHVGLLTGLPDAYGRGRIIGDYRRVALYGIDRLVEEKKKDLDKIEIDENNLEATIRLREEVSEQIRALGKIKNMAAKYGIDISKPATNAREAAQFLYLGYLAAVKENNGAAMSIGRNAGFLDIYIKRDMDRGILDEVGAQEIIDQLVIKLRLVRHLRTPDYDEVFGGDPTWVTESIGGMGLDGRTLVTKTAFRYLNTLINLGSAPEPNMTILWAEKLPEGWKKFCSKVSIMTDSIQYENDDLMRNMYGDDYAIACCVSAMEVGKEMQFFGARANLAKSLLYAINGGVDEKKKNKDGSIIRLFNDVEPITTEYLDYDKVLANYKKVLSELAGLYVKTLDVIHFMHDKYAYEAGQMALHDTYVKRNLATGVAGLSIAADSLSAIKYAKVKPVRDENGIAIDFETEGDFPKYGNDDDRVDQIAVDILTYFSNELKKHATYKNAKLTLSALTITSNVMYGKKTGTTPDGRKAGEPFAPGANPMHGRDESGALASLNSVAKLPYECVCEDGISNTFSIVPDALGKEDEVRIDNLVNIMDGYFGQDAFHLNVNVLQREKLLDAYHNPDKYPNLTIRVSGYAVHFNRLTDEQKREVLERTFHNHQ
ncbi:formate C-acetyltransferase [Anaerococcus lactolyticus]|uniref:Formate acetyltransferase n=2 Tax=Anaerococcus lactolyticus TaxID=33032 RepID=C2BHE8_9FIRM|nr:formate C-acetyltransferase [Anaerococcus lactolyticus]EEI85561.1 formate C-acetyltransferase [Anaerococcus lactolyticus ATCC 51172]KGF03297.1 formate acetyltransferase [Anaerococcus lactolyticus S7-1-13]